MKKRNPYQKRAEDAEALSRALEKENASLREGGAVRHERMVECIQMLEAAGMGKLGASPYGNTLVGMTHEAVDLIGGLRDALTIYAVVYHKNVERGNYYACQICLAEGEKPSAIQHSPECALAK